MAPLKRYAQKQILRELEWQCRSALAVADDLLNALRDQNTADITSVTRTLVVRVQKISELLWPGDRRLPDRLAENGGVAIRDQLQVTWESVLKRDRIEPLFDLLNADIDGDRPPARRVGPRWCVVRGNQCDFDLGPILDEVHRIWIVTTEEMGL